MIDLFNSTELFTVEEVAKQLKIKVATVRDKVFNKEIPYLKLGEGTRAPVRFYGQQLNVWLYENQYDPGSKKQPVPAHQKEMVKSSKKTAKNFENFLEKYRTAS